MLGERIRFYRKSKKFTGQELARRAGISRSLVSQVEKDSANPSIETLRKIAFALEIPIALLFEETIPPDGILVRKSNRKILKVPKSNLVYELLTPDLNRKIEFIWIEIEPGKQIEPVAFAHEGEECSIVIEGEYNLWIGDKEYVMTEGDSISFDSSIPHKLANLGSKKVVLITAITPPSF